MKLFARNCATLLGNLLIIAYDFSAFGLAAFVVGLLPDFDTHYFLICRSKLF